MNGKPTENMAVTPEWVVGTPHKGDSERGNAAPQNRISSQVSPLRETPNTRKEAAETAPNKLQAGMSSGQPSGVGTPTGSKTPRRETPQREKPPKLSNAHFRQQAAQLADMDRPVKHAMSQYGEAMEQLNSLEKRRLKMNSLK